MTAKPQAMNDYLSSNSPREHSKLLPAFAMIALIWALGARISGPSDLWGYTQHKTVSYTTDIINNGGRHWILPLDRGEFPATKPPLYNWMAVPIVKWLGFNSEIAHKFPSIIAICLCWAIVIRLGNAIDTGRIQSLGWLAGIILIANHTMMKLGYVARPDMLLTLWLTLAWIAATATFVNVRHSQGGAQGVSNQWQLAAAFWICVALASLTKGPPAVVCLLSALIAAKVIGGSWRTFTWLHPIAGLSFTALIAGGWLYAAWSIDSEHVIHTLWHQELYGRITGTGTEGRGGGLVGWFESLLHHPLYFLGRFFPWSLVAIAAIAVLWRRDRLHESKRLPEDQGRCELWMHAAAIHVVIIVVVFSLSTGKRADYIAAAFPPASLLAAWWLLRISPAIAVRFPWLVPVVAALALTAHTIWVYRQPRAPAPGYGSAISRFVDDAARCINAEELPLVICPIGNSHIPALLGSSDRSTARSAIEAQSIHESFWVIATKNELGRDCTHWLGQKRPVTVEAVLRSSMPESIEQLILYRVTHESE